MIEVDFGSGFRKALAKKIKRNPSIEEKFFEKLEIFLNDPYHPSLKTHKLSGKLSKAWSFSITSDCRVVFYFASQTKVVFFDIGTHDQVY